MILFIFIILLLTIIVSTIILVNYRLRFPYKILTLWIFVSLILLPIPFSLEISQYLNFANFYRVPDPFMYLIGPLIYIFTRSALFNEKFFYKTDWIHALPFLIHFFELIPLYLSSILVKQEAISHIDWNNLSYLVDGTEGFLSYKIHTIFKFVSSIVYIGLSIQILYSYIKKTNIINYFLVQIVFILVVAQAVLLFYVGITLYFRMPNFTVIIINLSNRCYI